LRITGIFAPICPRICARISGILAEDISASSSVNSRLYAEALFRALRAPVRISQISFLDSQPGQNFTTSTPVGK
jgi:hypothetical protein